MKQGTGNRRPGDQKVEPTSRAIYPGGSNNIGTPVGNHVTEGGTFTPKPTPLYDGKGYSAPPIRSVTSRKGGSQGRF